MSHILIIGQKTSVITTYLLDHGHTYTLIQDIKKTKFPDKHFKNRVVADFSSKESLIASLSQLKAPADAVAVTYENYVLPAAWVAEHLGLPGLPVEAAEACTDKFLMRSKFALAPEKVSPDFMIVEDEESLIAFAEAHQFPLILKPTNLAKSLLVTKSTSIDELLSQYRKSKELIVTIYAKYAPNRNPQFIVEEFLSGSIHSVDAFVDKNGEAHVLDQVVDYQTGYDIGYDDNFHYSRLLPSALSSDAQLALRHCAAVGIKALSMKNTPAHVEIILTPQGPRIVEIGARAGGYRDRMHMLANGIDIIGTTLELAHGRTPVIKATRNDPCAVLELFPKEPGAFRGISESNALRALSSLTYFSQKAKEGEFIGKAADGYKMAAVIILHNADSDSFNHDLAFINNSVHVETSS